MSSAEADAPIITQSRDDLMLIDAELRELYKAATLLPDGRSQRGRKQGAGSDNTGRSLRYYK